MEDVAPLEQTGSGRRRRAKSRAANTTELSGDPAAEFAARTKSSTSSNRRSRRLSQVPQVPSDADPPSDAAVDAPTDVDQSVDPLEDELAMIASGLAEKDSSGRRRHRRREEESGDAQVGGNSAKPASARSSPLAASGNGVDDEPPPPPPPPASMEVGTADGADLGEPTGGVGRSGSTPVLGSSAAVTGGAAATDRPLAVSADASGTSHLRLQVNMPPISIKQHFDFRVDQKVGDCMEKVVLTTPLLGKETAWGLFLLSGQQMPYHSRLGDFHLSASDTVELRVSEMAVPSPWNSLQQPASEKKSGRKAVSSFFNTLRRKKEKSGLSGAGGGSSSSLLGGGDDSGRLSPHGDDGDGDDGAMVGGPGDSGDSKWAPVIAAASKTQDEDPALEQLRGIVAELGADAVNCADGYGKTPLRAAAFAGNLAAVKFLLESGAVSTIDRKDNNGWTALHAAAQPGHWAVCEALLAAGAVPCEPFAQATSPLHFLARHEWRPDVSPRVLDMIVTSRLQAVNAINRQSATPLFEACSNSNVHVVRFLLDRGANVNRTNIAGETALHAAARAGCEDAVAALLERGVSRDVEGDNGTALDIAKSLGRKNVVTLLLQAAAPEAAAVQEAARVMHVTPSKSMHSLLSPRDAEVELADMCPALASLVQLMARKQEQAAPSEPLVLSAADATAMLAAGRTAAASSSVPGPASAAAQAPIAAAGAGPAADSPDELDGILAARRQRRAARSDLAELARKKNELPEFLASLRTVKSAAPLKTHLGLSNVALHLPLGFGGAGAAASAASSNSVGNSTTSTSNNTKGLPADWVAPGQAGPAGPAPIYLAPPRSSGASVFRASHRELGLSLLAVATPVRRPFHDQALVEYRDRVSHAVLSSKAAAKDPQAAVDCPFVMRTFSTEISRLPPKVDGALWHQVNLVERADMNLASFLSRRDCAVVASLAAAAGKAGATATADPADEGSLGGSRIARLGGVGGPSAASPAASAGGGGGGAGGGHVELWGTLDALRSVLAVARGWRRLSALAVQPDLSLTSGVFVVRVPGTTDLSVKVAPRALATRPARKLARQFAKLMYAVARRTSDLSVFGDGEDSSAARKRRTAQEKGGAGGDDDDDREVAAASDGKGGDGHFDDGRPSQGVASEDSDDGEGSDDEDDLRAGGERPPLSDCEFSGEKWWLLFVGLYENCLSTDPPSVDRICTRLLAMEQ